MIALKLSTWFLVIAFNLYWHIHGIVNNKQKPDYWLTFTYRFMALVLFGVLMTPWLNTPKEIGFFLPIIVYCLTTYMLIYNPAMNALKNKYADAVKVKWWYLGKSSGPIDRILNKYPLLYKILYFGAIPAFLWSLTQMKNYG